MDGRGGPSPAARPLCNVATAFAVCVAILRGVPAGAIVIPSVQSGSSLSGIRSLPTANASSQLQLQLDLKAAATKLEGIQSDVEAGYAKARAELVAVRDECQTQSSAAATRMQKQETSISTLQDTRNVQLEKQAQAEAELQAMKTAVDGKVVSYQSSVAQRANEATSYHNWDANSDKYEKALDGVIKMMKEKEAQLGDSMPGAGRVKGVFEGMKVDVAAKQKEMSKKHTDQDADYLALVTGYRKSLADTQAEYSKKRVQKETFQIAARDAGEERELRVIINKGDESVADSLVDLCAKDSGKVQQAMKAGDTRLTGVTKRISATVTDMKSMPDAFLQIESSSGLASGAPDLDSQRNEMLKMAAKVKTKQSHTFVSHHRRATKRKTLSVKMKTVAPTSHATAAKKLRTNKAAAAVRVLDSSLKGVATSAVVVAKQKLEATPTSMKECVNEKQRIASDITAARSAKEAAETEKRLAETSAKSIDEQIKMAQGQRKTLTNAENDMDSKAMPMMTMIATSSFVKDMDAAIQKLKDVETDVNTYKAKGGAPPEAAALPTALNNIETAIEQLRDDVQADLNGIQTVFTGKLMTAYPAANTKLEDKIKALEAEKKTAAADATAADKEAQKQQKAITKLNGEWDAVQSGCKPYLKGTKK